MSEQGFDPLFPAKLDQTYARLRKGLSSKKRDLEWRISQLHALKRLLQENDEAISKAMWEDLHKCHFECQATEQGVVLAEIEHTLSNLKSWLKPTHAATSVYNLPGKSKITHEPLGLVLIIGAWNFPINLTDRKSVV